MKNVIECSNSKAVVVFNDDTMEVKLYVNGYHIQKNERKITFTSRKMVPKVICKICIDSVNASQIVIRNKNVRLKAKNCKYHIRNVEEIIDFTPYNEKDDRVMTVDLVNKSIKVAFRKKEQIINFKKGVPFNDIREVVRKFFMKFSAAAVITEEDFFKPFRELSENNKQFNFLYKLKNADLGIDASNKIEYGVDISTCILSYKNYFATDVYSLSRWFANQLSGVLYMLNNPGVESVYNSPYKKELFNEIFFHEKTFEKSKLHEVLDIKKSTLKIMNKISVKIAKNISLLSAGAKCDINKIHKITATELYKNKKIIEETMSLLKSYNNIEKIIDDYFENCFYTDYFIALKAGCRFVDYYGKETGGQMQFEKAINTIESNLISIIYGLKALITVAPSYVNNVNHFSKYISNLSKKQGFQKVSHGIDEMTDYFKMQKYCVLIGKNIRFLCEWYMILRRIIFAFLKTVMCSSNIVEALLKQYQNI